MENEINKSETIYYNVLKLIHRIYPEVQKDFIKPHFIWALKDNSEGLKRLFIFAICNIDHKEATNLILKLAMAPDISKCDNIITKLENLTLSERSKDSIDRLDIEFSKLSTMNADNPSRDMRCKIYLNAIACNVKQKLKMMKENLKEKKERIDKIDYKSAIRQNEDSSKFG